MQDQDRPTQNQDRPMQDQKIKTIKSYLHNVEKIPCRKNYNRFDHYHTRIIIFFENYARI